VTGDVDNAIRRWWLHERPAVQAELHKAYRVGVLEEPALRMLHRAMRMAFIAGWNARDGIATEQQDLFGTDTGKHEGS
jgi:hypothetical protein